MRGFVLTMLSTPELQRTLAKLAFVACVLGGSAIERREATAQIRSLSYGINEKPIPPSEVIQASALRAVRGSISDTSDDAKTNTLHLGDQLSDRSSRSQLHLESIPAGEKLPQGSDKLIELIEFDDITLAEAMRLFAEQSGFKRHHFI